MWYFRASARGRRTTTKPFHDVSGLHPSTDAQTTPQRTLQIHRQVSASYQSWPCINRVHVSNEQRTSEQGLANYNTNKDVLHILFLQGFNVFVVLQN